jgi:hypothetical protein
VSYSLGIVKVENANATVQALWQGIVSGVPNSFHQNAELRFEPAGAVADAFRHILATGEVDFEVSSGTPVEGNTIEGPISSLLLGGTATGGGATTVTDSSAPWTAGQYIGDWVLVRGGVSTYTWGKITNSSTTTLTVEGWGQGAGNPQNGNSWAIHRSQTGAFGAFKRGTPQDWSAAGIQNGDVFAARGAWYQIVGVGTDTLTISPAWAGDDANGVPYTIPDGFTPDLSIPYFQPGDTQFPSINKRQALRIEELINFEAWRNFSDLGFSNGYGAGSPAPQYRKNGLGMVMFRGRLSGGTDDDTAATLPVGYRPGVEMNVYLRPTAATEAYDSNPSILQIGANGVITRKFGQSMSGNNGLDLSGIPPYIAEN